MQKFFGPLLFAALAAALWSSPNPNRDALANLAAPALLELPDSQGLPLVSLVLASVKRDQASAILSLAPTIEGGEDLERNLLAVLRANSHAALGRALRVERSQTGARFELTQNEDQIQLTWIPQAPLERSHRSSRFIPPTKTSLLPPLLAIGAALLLRRTAWALFLGVLSGAVLLRPSETIWSALPLGFLDVFRRFLWQRLNNPDNTRTILFVVLMLSMVGLMIRSGGIAGIMAGIARRAQSARSAAIAAWLMGLCVFFDDYSNTVLVGSTMRPLFDRLRIAREKLAYIVDSTAAPVASLSLFSTWIAFEVSTFAPQLPAAGISVSAGYAIFLETLPFRFYSILTLFFVGLIVISGRDFGPMRRAEERTRGGVPFWPGTKPMQGKRSTAVTMSAAVQARAHRAVVPLVAFVAVTIGSILTRGGALELDTAETFSFEGISKILLRGSGTMPLLIGSATGFALACLGCVRAGITREIKSASTAVLTSMGTAFAILYLAWMMGSVCRDLQTADFLTALFSESLRPELLPALLFGLGSLIAFATGSSWSTMMILLPLVVGLSFDLGQETAIGGHVMMLMSIGAVLEGSIFGDHCSPLSDTTVLSSISSASDHIDHVRTQAPYALLTMAAAMVCGYLPCALLGLSPLLGLAGGAAALSLTLLLWGRHPKNVWPR